MLKLHSDAEFFDNLTCSRACDGFYRRDFDYYDKDGFQLTIAERKLLLCNDVELRSCLNHWTWHRDWLKLDVGSSFGLHLDHCLLVHRPNFDSDALELLRNYPHPCAAFMVQAKPKWGLDFALDHIENFDAIEVLHIELDDYDLARISDRKQELESWLLTQDLLDMARRIRQAREQWQHLRGDAQNDWKARYLMGWDQAFLTEKSYA
jgi:hypothetical protein